MKGCPYDNAVAEAMFKVFKTEFANGAHFSTLEQLALELDDYVHWFNNIRIHGTLGYLTPVEIQATDLIIFVQFSVDIPREQKGNFTIPLYAELSSTIILENPTFSHLQAFSLKFSFFYMGSLLQILIKV